MQAAGRAIARADRLAYCVCLACAAIKDSKYSRGCKSLIRETDVSKY